MEPTIEIPIEQLARQLKLTPEQVTRAIPLLDAGYSVPFLALFRLDETAGLGEGSLFRLSERVQELRQIERKKKALVDYLQSRNALDEMITADIQAASSREQIDLLQAIHKKSRVPKGAVERRESVHDLASRVLQNSIDLEDFDVECARIENESDAFASLEDVRAAVRDTLIQHFVHSYPLRLLALRIMRETGRFTTRRCQESDSEEPDDLNPIDAASQNPDAPGRSDDSTSSLGDHSSDQAAADTVPESVQVEDELRSQEPTSAPAVAELTSATLPLASMKKRPVAIADDRRQRRKQARMRRRAHLETALRDYFNASFPLSKLTVFQFADIDYGERVRVLSANLEFEDARLDREAIALSVPESSRHGVLLETAWREAKARFIIPDCLKIIRREFTDDMEHQVVAAIKRHVRNLLMQRPLHQPLLAISAHRDGFSLVATDQYGHILASEDLPRSEFGPDMIHRRIRELVAQYYCAYVAFGSSERTRLIHQMLVDSLGQDVAELGAGWLAVPEDGIGSYCRSAIGCEEIPAVLPEHRTTIAMAHRVRDPLGELVKVAPREWLTDQQQATVSIQRLEQEIRSVYQSCLARIGVDVNIAPPSVLRQLPGLDEPTARKIEAHRIAHGAFDSLSALCQAIHLGPAQDELLGYLRVRGGSEPLDAIGIHPRQYELAERMLEHCELTKKHLEAEVGNSKLPQVNVVVPSTSDAVDDPGITGNPEQPTLPPTDVPRSHAGRASANWDQRFRSLDFQKLSESLGVGREQIRRLVNELRYAGRDVRDNSRLPVTRNGSLRVDDLQPSEMLSGQVVNLANFGAFVEIAPGTVGLIHVSRLGDGFVRDPREVLLEGERLPVWVLSIDKERKRIALSLSPPGIEQTNSRSRPRSQERPASQRPASQPSSKSSSRAAGTSSRRPNRSPPPMRKPKYVAPITEGMKLGQEPMRTFGDLKQFFDFKQAPESKKPAKHKPTGGNDPPVESG